MTLSIQPSDATSAHTLDLDALANAIVRAPFLEATSDALVFDLGQDRKAHVERDEFGEDLPFQVGDDVTLLVEDQWAGAFRASIKKAEKLAIWDWVQATLTSGKTVEGLITVENKGGLSVSLLPDEIGLRAFLPKSQIDLHHIDDCSPYLGRREAFQILKFDRRRGNIVVSRKKILEAAQKEERETLLDNLEKGQTHTGVVRNLTDYGAFVDIGGIDGLLHVTNMSWGRVDHPSELVRPGDSIEVVVLDWNPEKRRLGLGRKQLLEDPWTDVDTRFEVGQIVEGKVVSLADFGAFVSIDQSLEGLVHVTELSWTQRINHPRDVLNLEQEVKVKIIGIDPEKRRLSLSIKAMEDNPWVAVAEEFPPNTKTRGPIKTITDFGLFVELKEGVEGLVHVSDLSWTEKIENPAEHFDIGQEIDVLVLDIDVESQRLSLGIKQLEANPWQEAEKLAIPGNKIEVTITRLTDFGAFAELVAGVEGLIHISELSEERINQASEVVRPGQTVTALVLSFDRASERIGLSMKRDELDDESSTMREYSDDTDASSTTLGDIFRDRLGLDQDEETN